jgi:hypothetical protein
MSLVDYWPTSDKINACIKPEAEGASAEVLLAVHQPAPLAYRLARSTELIPTSEAELFDYFISEDVPTGAHVVPITGHSGVGKSHLVRLIAARLSALPDAKRYVPVRIPKSASLRKVVESILELLPAKPYASVRNAFDEALTEVDPGTAAIRFQSALDISLRDLAQELTVRLKQNSANQELRQQLDHARRLPLLLSDALTRDHFRDGVLSRIVQSALSGRRNPQDDAVQQFSAQDLDLPSSIDLTKAAEPVQLYYRTALQAREGHGKKVAAEILNTVLDAAIRQLFHLNESLGGMTLQDVILAIRSQLLKDGRELVILVEDFRALTGIQETLLNVLIQEGVRDGRQIYATMRSAIAVTEGYLTGKDTIATRATREWIIQSQLATREEVFRRTQQLVASYLNAARWGQEALARSYTRETIVERAGEIGAPVFNAEENDAERRRLEAFGRVSGVPLFPLTTNAIEYLADLALKEGDTLVFKPRAILVFLRDVLLFGREPYVGGSFPPASIKARAPAEDVAQWLSTQRLSNDQRERFERLIVIWGNSPQDRTQVSSIPAEVFTTFSLPLPTGIETRRRELIQPIRTSASSQAAPTTSPDDRKVARLAEYRKELESWVQEDGPQLNQTVAGEIRSSLAIVLNDRIDWTRERCLKMTIGPNQIAIPHSRGKGGEAANAIPLAVDRSDPDGQLRAELIALLRFHQVWKKDMNYAEVEDDLARIGNLADRLLPATLLFIRTAAVKQTRLACALLAANSRLLGITDGGRTPGALKSFLLDPGPAPSELPDASPEAFVNWAAAQQKAGSIRSRLIEALLESCGCYQGTGKTPNGIDIIRVVQAFSEDIQAAASDLASLPPDVKGVLAELGEPRVRIRAKQAATEANRIKEQLEARLGQAFDKNSVADAVLDLGGELRELGLWSETEIGTSYSAFKTLCENFRSCALKEALEQLARVNLADDGSSPGVLIAQVAKVKFGPLVVALRFVTVSETVIAYADRHAKTTEDQYHDLRPEIHIGNLSNELDRTASDLTEHQNDGSQIVTAKRA